MSARKPAWIKHLEGNRGHSRIRDELTTFGSPDLPSYFTKAQRERWDEIVRSLPKGLLTRADTNAIERMAVAWALFREITAICNKEPLAVKGSMGTKKRNPLILIRKQLSDEMRACASELGLSPYA